MRLIIAAVLGGAACLAGCSRPRGVERPYISEGGTDSMHVTDDRKPEALEPFKLPADVGGKLLAGVLPPTKRPGVLENPARPRPAAAPAPKLVALEPELPSMPTPAPKLPKAAKDPRPHTVTDEALDEGFDAPAVPAKPSFDPSPLVKEPSESDLVPPPLPYLALPPVDRVPLDD